MLIAIITMPSTKWLMLWMYISYMIQPASPTIHQTKAGRNCPRALTMNPINTNAVQSHPNASITDEYLSSQFHAHELK